MDSVQWTPCKSQTAESAVSRKNWNQSRGFGLQAFKERGRKYTIYTEYIYTTKQIYSQKARFCQCNTVLLNNDKCLREVKKKTIICGKLWTGERLTSCSQFLVLIFTPKVCEKSYRFVDVRSAKMSTNGRGKEIYYLFNK